jgi:hypothetical protein
VKREDAIKYVQQNQIVYSDTNGRNESFKVGASAGVVARQLVFYALPENANTLAIHLAWAVEITDAPVKTVYVDAIEAKILGAE